MSRARIVWGLWVGLVCRAWAEMPQMFLYEGTYEREGAPYTGWAEVCVQLYTNQEALAPSFVTTATVYVTEGHFAAPVMGDGEGRLSDILQNGEVYGEVVIEGQTQGVRALLMPVALALRAGGVTAGGVSGEMLATNSVQRGHIAPGAVGSAQLAEEAVSGWHIEEGSVELRDLNVEELDARYIRKAGDECEGGLTNRVGFWGNGWGLTNLSPAAMNAATSFVKQTGGSMTGPLTVRARVQVDVPASVGTNATLTRVLLSNRKANGQTCYWFVQVGASREVSGVQPNAFELWEYPNGLGGSTPRLRVLSSGEGTNLATEVVVGSDGSLGVGCWPSGAAKLEVAGGVRAERFAGDGYALTNLAPEALDVATSFVRRSGGTVVGSLRVSSNFTVMGTAYLYEVPPQGGLSMGPFTNR